MLWIAEYPNVSAPLSHATAGRTLRDRLGDAFCAGLVVYPGESAYRLDDRIAAVPLGVLA